MSTTLHIEYTEPDFLTSNSYSPFIVFNIPGPTGQPYTYSVASTPAFDGYTFEIPREITINPRNAVVEYQLFFLRNKVEWNGEIDELVGTEYLHSQVDRLVIRPGIRPKGRVPAGGAMLPYTEPNIAGWIEYFKEYASILPMHAEEDPVKDRIVLVFRTYNGNQVCHITLDVPRLDENGKVPSRFLDMIHEWGTGADDSLPSAKLVADSLALKTDKVKAIEDWNAEWTYSRGSTVIGPDGIIYRSDSDDNIGNEPALDSGNWVQVLDISLIVDDWDGNVADDRVPSVRLVADGFEALRVMLETGLESKLDDSQIVDSWSEVPSERLIPSERLVKTHLDDERVRVDGELAAKMDDSQVLGDWDGLDRDRVGQDIQVPSAILAKDSLDHLETNKADRLYPISEYDSAQTYGMDALVIRNGNVYISTANENAGYDPVYSPEYWAHIGNGGVGGGADNQNRVESYTIGDGDDSTSYVVNHTLGTPDLFVEIRTTEPPYEYVYAKIEVMDDEEKRYPIIITTANPLKKDELRVLVSACPDTTGRYVDTIRNKGGEKDIEIRHSLGTTDLLYRVRTTAEPIKYVHVNMSIVTRNTVCLHFARPPADEEFTILLASYFPDSTSDFHVHEQTEPSEVWHVEHDLGRMVSVYVVDDQGTEMPGVATQDLVNHEYVDVVFSEPVTGKVYLR